MDICFFDNVKYGEHERNILDVSFPDGVSGRVDLVLMIHGGAWTAGNKDMYKNMAEAVSAKGYAAAAVNYRYICETVSCHDIMNDISAALLKIKTMGTERGIDIEKVLLSGVSAGAHISLQYAYSMAKSAPIKPAAVVSLCGPADMVSETAAEKFIYHNEMGGPELIFDLVSWLGGRRITEENMNDEESLSAMKAVSPVFFVNRDTVPTVICHGEEDIIVPYENALALDKALTECGVAHDLVPYPHSGHGLDKDPESTKRGEALTWEYIGRYLTKAE